MNDEDYMSQAIAAATNAEQDGGLAIGVIIVKDGQVVAVNQNQPAGVHDSTAHSEMTAIRAACEKLRTENLEGCIMYDTLEPCSMCLSAAIWANISAVYFGAYAADVPKNPYALKNYSAEELVKASQLWNGEPIKAQGGILRDECKKLLEDYENWQKAAA